MSRPLSNMPWFKPCGHPGCDVKIRKDCHTYDVGLCAKHGGRRKGRATIAVAKPHVLPERAGVRYVEVAAVRTPAAGSSGDYKRVRVSLPREPWA